MSAVAQEKRAVVRPPQAARSRDMTTPVTAIERRFRPRSVLKIAIGVRDLSERTMPIMEGKRARNQGDPETRNPHVFVSLMELPHGFIAFGTLYEYR